MSKSINKIATLEWLVKNRSRNQACAVKLFKLLTERERQIKLQRSDMFVQGLVGVTFSLWRAVFLADKRGIRAESLKSATEFLETMIADNAIGYLKRETLKGCPATWWYVIVFRCVKNETSTYSNRPPTERVTNGTSGCRENDAHHISNSFQEKIIKERSVGAASAAGAAAPTQRQTIPPARITEFLRELHEAVESPK